MWTTLQPSSFCVFSLVLYELLYFPLCFSSPNVVWLLKRIENGNDVEIAWQSMEKATKGKSLKKATYVFFYFSSFESEANEMKWQRHGNIFFSRLLKEVRTFRLYEVCKMIAIYYWKTEFSGWVWRTASLQNTVRVTLFLMCTISTVPQESNGSETEKSTPNNIDPSNLVMLNIQFLSVVVAAYLNFEVERKTLCHTCYLNDYFVASLDLQMAVERVSLRVCVCLFENHNHVILHKTRHIRCYVVNSYACGKACATFKKRWIKHTDTRSESTMQNTNVIATLNFSRMIKKKQTLSLGRMVAHSLAILSLSISLYLVLVHRFKEKRIHFCPSICVITNGIYSKQTQNRIPIKITIVDTLHFTHWHSIETKALNKLERKKILISFFSPLLRLLQSTFSILHISTLAVAVIDKRTYA